MSLLITHGAALQRWHLPAELSEPRRGGSALHSRRPSRLHLLLVSADWFARCIGQPTRHLVTRRQACVSLFATETWVRRTRACRPSRRDVGITSATGIRDTRFSPAATARAGSGRVRQLSSDVVTRSTRASTESSTGRARRRSGRAAARRHSGGPPPTAYPLRRFRSASSRRPLRA